MSSNVSTDEALADDTSASTDTTSPDAAEPDANETDALPETPADGGADEVATDDIDF